MESMPKRYCHVQLIPDLLAYGIHLSTTRKEMPLSNYAKLVDECEISVGYWVDGHLNNKRT
jgi:hypothetical protein